MNNTSKFRLLATAIEDDNLMMSEKVLFTYMLIVCNSDFVVRYWSLSDLVKATKIARSTIIKSISRLEKLGFIMPLRSGCDITEYQILIP